MTDTEKISKVKTFLGEDAPSDDDLSIFLSYAAAEICAWNNIESGAVPKRYEQAQIQSVVVGCSLLGAEGERQHNENGINRTFVYSTIDDYIHTHVNPGARLYK